MTDDQDSARQPVIEGRTRQAGAAARVAVEIGAGIEWLCEPELVGWRTSAGGYDGPLHHPTLCD